MEKTRKYATYIICVNIFLILSAVFIGLPKEGIQALLPNYILISTAILAVTFAAIAINKTLNKEEQQLAGITAAFSILGIYSSIFCLYLSYINGDFYFSPFYFSPIKIIFYGATFCVITSILAIALLAAKIIEPEKKD